MIILENTGSYTPSLRFHKEIDILTSDHNFDYYQVENCSLGVSCFLVQSVEDVE